MSTELCCARCGRSRPSLYYFRAPALCIDCFQRMSDLERQDIESSYPTMPWQRSDVSPGVETPRQRLALSLLAVVFGAVALFVHAYVRAATMALVLIGCAWREYRHRRHVTA